MTRIDDELTIEEREHLFKVLYGRKHHILRKFQTVILEKDPDHELLREYAEDIRKLDSIIRKVEDSIDEIDV